MSEARNCPFCGEPGPGPVDATKILGVWRMIHRCKVVGPISLENETREGVLETWNTRAEADR